MNRDSGDPVLGEYFQAGAVNLAVAPGAVGWVQGGRLVAQGSQAAAVLKEVSEETPKMEGQLSLRAVN